MKLLPLEDSIMFSQYDGLVGIKHLHSEEDTNIFSVMFRRPIYDMDFAYKKEIRAIVLCAGENGLYLLRVSLDSISKRWDIHQFILIKDQYISRVAVVK